MRAAACLSWLSILLAGGCGSEARPARTSATFLGDAPASTTRTNGGLVLHKTLDAYTTFGGYDVAYTGQTARWTFTVPAMKVKSARLVLSMDADDHATPIGEYAYTLWAGDRAYETPVSLHHGTPANAPFGDWIEVSVPVDVVPGETLTVSLTNAATGASPMDWIAVRWIELRLA